VAQISWNWQVAEEEIEQEAQEARQDDIARFL